MGSRSSTRVVAASLAIAATLAVSACGGGGSGGTGDGAAGVQSGRSAAVADFRASNVAGAPKTQVVAQDNRFVPENIRVSVGQTVRWTNQGRNPHNIRPASEDAEYAKGFGVREQAFPRGGGTYEFTFTKPGIYEYFCSLHGTRNQGMVGAVIVGDGDWSPPKVRPAAARRSGTLRVPQDYPTIQTAVDAAAEGALVLVAPGVYHEAVVVNSPRIVIRGADRTRTVVDGRLRLDNGFHVFADGVAIENITARRFKTNGFFWDGVTGYRGSYLTAYNNGDYGVYAFASVSGQFDHSYASGSPDSSFYVGQCDPCKALLIDLHAQYSELGYSGTNATGVVIARSRFDHNRIGIVPNSQDVEELAPVRRNTFVGNLVFANSNLDAATASNSFYDVAVGSGIVMAGTVDSAVLRNRVDDHDWFGILLAPFPSDPNYYPVNTTRVEGNVVTGSRHADLALVFSNSKQGNCFTGNTFSTSAPADIEVRLPCTGAPDDDLSPGAIDPGMLLDRQGTLPKGRPYWRQPVPPSQPNMPGDARTAPPVPATPDRVPVRVDVRTIPLPHAP
jgi:plastocyanin